MSTTTNTTNTTGPITAGDVALYVDQRGADPTSCSSPGSAIPPKPGHSNSTGSPTSTA